MLFLASNENLRNLVATRKEKDENYHISNTSYQEESEDFQHNLNSLPEIISSDPHFSQITYSIIESKSDNVSKAKEDNLSPQL